MWNAEDFVDFFFIHKILYIDYNSLVSTLNLVLWKANQYPDAQQTPLRPLVQLEILGYCMLFFSCVISLANELMTGKKFYGNIFSKVSNETIEFLTKMQLCMCISAEGGQHLNLSWP